jgi:hypothetical protein
MAKQHSSMSPMAKPPVGKRLQRSGIAFGADGGDDQNWRDGKLGRAVLREALATIPQHRCHFDCTE